MFENESCPILLGHHIEGFVLRHTEFFELKAVDESAVDRTAYSASAVSFIVRL